MNKYELLKERIENDFTEEQLVELHNAYCYMHDYYDDVIHYMSEFDEFASSMTPTDIVYNYGELNTQERFFQEGVYQATSFDYYCDCSCSLLDDIVKWAVDNDEDFRIRELRGHLDDLEEEEEDD